MGIPYSKEINKAFVELNNAYGQVTPLVAAAYEVLETTKNISLLVAGIQVLNTILLSILLMCTLGLLITVNPDLDKERAEIVTPAIRWIVSWANVGRRVVSVLAFLMLMVGVGGVAMIRRSEKWLDKFEEGDEKEGAEKEGEDGGAVVEGEEKTER